MLQERIKELSNREGIVLVGFPRDIIQAQNFEERVKGYSSSGRKRLVGNCGGIASNRDHNKLLLIPRAQQVKIKKKVERLCGMYARIYVITDNGKDFVLLLYGCLKHELHILPV